MMRGVVKITDVLEDCKVGALGSKCKCDIVSQFSQTAFSCVLCLFGLLSSSSLKSTDYTLNASFVLYSSLFLIALD